MEESIYQQICNNISDGILKPGFVLPEQDEQDSDDFKIKWAPGAMDGISFYHMFHAGLDAGQAKGMARALKCAASRNFPETDAMFFEWTKDVRAISCIDELQRYVIGHARTLDPGNVFHTALSMVLHSKHMECVKIGLALLELFGEPEENLKAAIRRIGLYDEFTIFAVWNMQKWKNGNDEIFDLAQKVHGWGRIHAVERLEPDTDEIRHWLLTEGTINYVENTYSSLTCWQKSGAEELLSGNPTPEEYAAITTLIDGLMDEGPVPGISEIDHAEPILLRYLELSSEYILSADEYNVISFIKCWADDADMPSVTAACDQILDSKRCMETILAAVKEGKEHQLSDELVERIVDKEVSDGDMELVLPLGDGHTAFDIPVEGAASKTSDEKTNSEVSDDKTASEVPNDKTNLGTSDDKKASEDPGDKTASGLPDEKTTSEDPSDKTPFEKKNNDDIGESEEN